jgi:hypothetical protein
MTTDEIKQERISRWTQQVIESDEWGFLLNDYMGALASGILRTPLENEEERYGICARFQGAEDFINYLGSVSTQHLQNKETLQ